MNSTTPHPSLSSPSEGEERVAAGRVRSGLPDAVHGEEEEAVATARCALGDVVFRGGNSSGGFALETHGLKREAAAVFQFQIIFNPTSAAELARMPRDLQLHILGEFRGLPQEVLTTDLEHFGKLERHGKILHRFRLGDYRIYFERHELGVVVHRILSKNTLKDFRFRTGLPLGEDEALQENPKFWEMIESARTLPAKM